VELWEAIQGRRSVRSFRPEAVRRDDLIRLVEAAIWAPSGGNAQTWRFVIVTDPDQIGRLRTVSPGLLGDPPAVIAVCQDLEASRRLGSTLGETFLAIADAAMATQNLLLAAHGAGLGTCVIASFHRGAVGRILRLHNGVEAMLLVSVGRPASIPPPPERRRDGVIFFEVQDGA